MIEKEVEDYFVWKVAMLGGKSYKFKSPNQRGVSDQVACMVNGHTWFVELKRPKGGKLSELQKLFARDMLGLNQKYALLNTKEQIDEWAKQFETA